ncbi:GATA zinc finger domain-containing protein 14-like [Condylostylus longicornis]|uniref:GATA zinc finger domain-containing protein 14-like n=1 Tax=Condylostylus longicornis TaxID=2530218 RepID=UPI00244E2E36|nr:GATA zinc finger domain-containing protein 14-like [Condylostylus longicornis]
MTSTTTDTAISNTSNNKDNMNDEMLVFENEIPQNLQQKDNDIKNIVEKKSCNTSTNLIPNINNNDIPKITNTNDINKNNCSTTSCITNLNSSNVTTTTDINQIDLLNSSICSFESHISLVNGNNKRIIEQSNITMTGTNTNGLAITTEQTTTTTSTGISNQRKSFTSSKIMKSNTNLSNFYDNRYHPPQYTAIYFDTIPNTTNPNTNLGIRRGDGGGGNGMGIGIGNITQQHYNNSDLANNIEIINDVIGNDSNQYGGTTNNNNNNVGTNRIDSNRAIGTVDIIQRRRRGIGCFRQWFTRPSLPFIIGILALGGVACTLGVLHY